MPRVAYLKIDGLERIGLVKIISLYSQHLSARHTYEGSENYQHKPCRL
jgi:hypothetical protein